MTFGQKVPKLNIRPIYCSKCLKAKTSKQWKLVRGFLPITDVWLRLALENLQSVLLVIIQLSLPPLDGSTKVDIDSSCLFVWSPVKHKQSFLPWLSLFKPAPVWKTREIVAGLLGVPFIEGFDVACSRCFATSITTVPVIIFILVPPHGPLKISKII